MPYIKIQTNVRVSDPETILKEISALAAKELGKPEAYVQCVFAPVDVMVFGGSSDPSVFVEFKSIGLSTALTGDLSKVFCGRLSDRLGVSPDRIYIEFSDAPGAMWGFNGTTFG